MRSLKIFYFLFLVFLFICWGCGGFSSGKKRNMEVTETFGPIPAEQLLGMAENRFKTGDYNAALRAYEAFEKMHPGSELLPYCIFGQGLCYFERRETFDRDQTATRKAMECFHRVAERYPNWKYTADAKGKIAECRRLLAENEFYIASYYQRTRRYKAAIVRYQGLVRDYPEFTKAAEAKKGIAECKIEMAKPLKTKGFLTGLFDAQW